MVSYQSQLPSGNYGDHTSSMRSLPQSNYLSIFKETPSYRHLNIALVTTRLIFLVAVSFSFAILYYLITKDLNLGFIAAISVFAVLLIIFYPKLRARVKSNDLFFFESTRDNYTLFSSSRANAYHIAFQIFKVVIMPENVRPNMSKFVSSLYNLNIPFTYQVESLPEIFSQSKEQIVPRSNMRRSPIKNLPINFCIYFTVFTKQSGLLFPWKIYTMIKNVNEYANALRMVFFANFHHYKIDRLENSQLVARISGTQKKEVSSFSNSDPWIMLIVLRSVTIIVLGIVFSALLSLLVGIGWVIVTSLIITIGFLWLFLRDLYTIFNYIIVELKPKSIVRNYALKNVNVAKPSKIGDAIQIIFDQRYIALYRCFSLKFARQPLYGSSKKNQKIYPFFTIDKFYEAIVSSNLFFTITNTSIPLNYREFLKESQPFFTDRTKEILSKLEKPSEKKSFLETRHGIWKSVLTYSIYSIRAIDDLNEEVLTEMLQEVEDNAITLKNTFHMNLKAFEIEEIPRKKLETAFLVERLKNSDILPIGTGLNYLIFQGVTLGQLNYISSHFRKGIDTRIASEFISPLHLPNQLIMGDVLDTEHFNGETRFGFTFSQISNLLLTNGDKRLRQAALMKIVAEITICDKSCIVFDHMGNWSILIKLFQDTEYSNHFAYYKLGDMFRLHYNLTATPSNPDILKFNAEYMNLFCDAFELSYQQKHFNPDVAKEMLLSNESDVSTEATRLQHVPPWESPLGKDLIMNLQQLKRESNFFVGKGEISHEKNVLENTIYSNKTVIIDLSGSNDLKTQLFAQYLMLAKIIYNLKSNSSESRKTILLPRGDSFFTDYFVETNRYDYKVANFLEPLLNHEFGFIFTANQVRYCHSSFLNYFTNILAFRTFDHNDIDRLKALMNLDLLHGTGVYSTSRNETFQTHFLKNLNSADYECLVKRDDNDQPFPVRLNLSNFINAVPMTKQEIYAYMKSQGYQPERVRELILKSIEKSLFEIHFKPYEVFIPEIIQFLTAVKRQETIGNLYESHLKGELLKFIVDKATKISQVKKIIRQIRNELFEKMETHRYLIKQSVTTAAGSESIRSSYKVGEQFERSLSEYRQKREDLRKPPTPELIEQETPYTEIGANKGSFTADINKESHQIDPLTMKVYLSQENDALISNLFRIFKSIQSKRFRDALQIEKSILRSFFHNLYKRLFHRDKVLISEDIQLIIELLQNKVSFPYNAAQVMELITTIDNINPHLDPTEAIVTDLYNKITIFQLNIAKVLN